MTKAYQGTKLQGVTIRGYKSIAYDRPVTLKLDNVSVLLGTSGAGKGNIVSFFRILGYMMSKPFGRYVEISGTSRALLHYDIKRTPIISEELEFADSDSMDVYDSSLANTTPDRLIIMEEQVTWYRRGEKEPYKIALEPNFKESALAEHEDPAVKTTFQMLSYYRMHQSHDSSTEGSLCQACPVEVANHLQLHGSNLSSFPSLLQENYKNAYNRIVDYVRDVVLQPQDFYLEPVGSIISLR